MNKLKQLVEKVLKQDDRLWNKDKTDFNQTLLIDLVEKIDVKVISLLLQEEEIREKFFIKIKDCLCFKTNDFRFFMEENKIDNSYTAYKSRIGLTDGKKFLKDTDDVVLNFPYKDCVLEGGQSTEEGTDAYFGYSDKTESYEQKTAKRKEIFFNQVLAHDEIDRLCDIKALTNWKRFTKEGEQKVTDIKRDEDGTIKENLIIKGNNLLALYSLKQQFAGKVKLIYIDPPYNTGNDGFKYNDAFNHSTWLTFMKNRLEIARQLLRDDGGIFVSCDDNEQAYLKVLMDEVFGRDNFIMNFAVIRSEGGGLAKQAIKGHDHLILFSKKISSFVPLKKPKDIRGKKVIKDGEEYWIEDDWLRKEFGKYGTCHYEEIEKIKGINEKINVDNCLKNGTYVLVPKKNGLNAVGRLRLIKEDGTKFYSVLKHLNANGNDDLKHLEINFTFPKPTSLLKEIISGSTFFSKNDEDIILDFFAGSGTTAHAVLELNKEDGGNRKFIMVEQMDYINTVTCPRVQNVMKKEGIDDSFIYLELTKWNEKAKEQINACESVEELTAFFDEMYDRYFLNYNLKLREFREKVLKETEFRSLPLEEQKKMFLTMLDLNQMYVNKTEMADAKYSISEEDQKLTELFYNK